MSDPSLFRHSAGATDAEWRRQIGVICTTGDRDLVGILERPEPVRSIDALERTLKRQCLAMSVAGHDLKQPLQVITMVLERLGRQASTPREQMWLDVAKGEIGRLDAGLDELAVLSRADDREAAAPMTAYVPVDEVLDDLMNTWRHHAKAKGLRLTRVPSTLAVRTNRRLLSVILGNLISNAIKYTTHGGVLIGCRRHRDGIAIEVIDTGRGIDLGASNHFAPFWRQDNDMSGLGLGMSIVAQTADLLNHQVTAKSTPGRGSRFSVLIPS